MRVILELGLITAQPASSGRCAYQAILQTAAERHIPAPCKTWLGTCTPYAMEDLNCSRGKSLRASA